MVRVLTELAGGRLESGDSGLGDAEGSSPQVAGQLPDLALLLMHMDTSSPSHDSNKPPGLPGLPRPPTGDGLSSPIVGDRPDSPTGDLSSQPRIDEGVEGASAAEASQLSPAGSARSNGGSPELSYKKKFSVELLVGHSRVRAEALQLPELRLCTEADLRSLVADLAAQNVQLNNAVRQSTQLLQKQVAVTESFLLHCSTSSKNEKKEEGRNGVDSVSLHNLSTQLDVAEEAQAQLSQDLQRVTCEKLELANHMSSLQLELERGREELLHTRDQMDRLQQEKWELSAVNADLQQRLQQTVALAHMQAEGNQSRLQEEVGRLLGQLEEERQVTANLSKNLELERRKVESLEQKAKGIVSKGKENYRRRSSLLPEEVRDSEARLTASMELYSQRCDNLGGSLASCQQQLVAAMEGRNAWQPDLATEISKLRKLLSEEKRSCHLEGERIREVHHLFEQVYQDYTSALDTIKQAHQEKKFKSQQSVLENIKESNIRDNVDSLTARLMMSEESLAKERETSHQLRERLAQCELDLEALPLLKAQVDVYQADFNAERQARERIAGEKADMEEELRKLKNRPVMPAAADPPPPIPAHQLAGGGSVSANLRERMNNFAERPPDRPPPPRPGFRRDEEAAEEGFTCPKCNREFRNTTLLTRHVNDCLDRDF